MLTQGARAKRRAAAKPAGIAVHDRPLQPPDEGLQARAERRAAPKPAARWRNPPTGRLASALAPLGAEPGHQASCGRFVPGEGLGRWAQRGLQGRLTYPSGEGQT